MRSRFLVLAALAALVVAPVNGSSAAGGVAGRADAPTVHIRPGALPKGDGPATPMQVGRSVVDGDTRVRLPAHSYLLGKSGTAYVVAGSGRVLRVEADGTTTRIARPAESAELTLSRDGAHVVVTRTKRGGRTDVTVLDAETGARLAHRRFSEYATVAAADEGRLVLSTWGPPRTFWWDFVSGGTSRIVGRVAGHADIRADRLATFTGDPYDGGCTVVTSLRHPKRKLWRSCAEAVVAFSPHGRRMATTHILADGLGPNEVHARTVHGREIASYAAYWFGTVEWETDTALLLDAHTKHRTALVRCAAAECERASAVRRSSAGG
ncbi:hypothetical protein [Nocardioides sp. YIM 152315]|uniref:hypothetical protein n=1 Tax=Nocardioides sp. YIM 152315 TaxID=3031760 RepID=UPI0023DA551C|nr:hypothetical protein [Nocardioides sp. YIM 152315]MDF1605029.1 hypothetical protein [Nocardioides sp. YIM 152315]